MGKLDQLWRQEAGTWAFSRVSDGDAHECRIVPDEDYVEVILRQIRLINARIGYSRFYGAVHSYAKLGHLSGSPIEFTTVATPTELKNVSKKHLDRFVLSGHRLLGPAPYRGGDLELRLGLFSIKSQDMLQPYLDLLGELSSLAGVSFYSSALPFIAPIKQGFELMTNTADGCVLEIGLTATFDAPRSGNYFVARLRSEGRSLDKFTVDQDFHLRDENGLALSGVPYMVFSIQTSRSRGDWYAIPPIAEAYESLNKAVAAGSPFPLISSYEQHFNRVVLTSPDILQHHATEIVDWVKARVAAALEATRTRGGGTTQRLPELNSLVLSSS